MPIGIFIDESKDLTTLDCYGDVYFVDFVEAIFIFSEEINQKHTRKLFCDMRKTEYLELSAYQLDKLAELYVSKSRGTRTAVLSPTKSLFQTSKAFEMRVPDEKRNFKLFKTIDASNEWLEN